MELEQQIKIAVEGCGVMLYDITTTRVNADNIFRIMITSPGGVNLDKCQEVSKMISPLLDIKDPMKGVYRLEVSSPGIERKLSKKEHFKGSVGENIKAKNFSSEKFKGKLLDYKADTLKFIDEDGEEFTLEFDDILSASTYYNWN